jgi:hypothetical protein
MKRVALAVVLILPACAAPRGVACPAGVGRRRDGGAHRDTHALRGSLTRRVERTGAE